MYVCVCSVYGRWENWCRSAGLTTRPLASQPWGWRRPWRRCWSPKTSNCDGESRQILSSAETCHCHLRWPIEEREKRKKTRLWMMGQRKLTGRMSDRDNGPRESRKMRGERFITPGEVCPPVVWATSASDQVLRLCFLWKLNGWRVQTAPVGRRTGTLGGED